MHDEHPAAHRQPVFVLADPPARLPLMRNEGVWRLHIYAPTNMIIRAHVSPA